MTSVISLFKITVRRWSAANQNHSSCYSYISIRCLKYVETAVLELRISLSSYILYSKSPYTQDLIWNISSTFHDNHSTHEITNESINENTIVRQFRITSIVPARYQSTHHRIGKYVVYNYCSARSAATLFTIKLQY